MCIYTFVVILYMISAVFSSLVLVTSSVCAVLSEVVSSFILEDAKSFVYHAKLRGMLHLQYKR